MILSPIEKLERILEQRESIAPVSDDLKYRILIAEMISYQPHFHLIEVTTKLVRSEGPYLLAKALLAAELLTEERLHSWLDTHINKAHIAAITELTDAGWANEALVLDTDHERFQNFLKRLINDRDQELNEVQDGK